MASIQDDQVLKGIHQALSQQDILPAVHLVDAGYTDVEGLVSSQRDYGITLLGPVAVDASWQARAGEGFDKASFLIDWEQKTVICPAGKQNYSWLPSPFGSRGVIGGVRVQFWFSHTVSTTYATKINIFHYIKAILQITSLSL
ncbi:MAG TPA: hypothetical protein VFV38_35705 [Ktedonobacteraceae bacterium]|nr:hypothetical protein [Ktedonobacteraceae bacterium]